MKLLSENELVERRMTKFICAIMRKIGIRTITLKATDLHFDETIEASRDNFDDTLTIRVKGELESEDSQMKIWKLSQGVVRGYDTYNSCIVVARNEDEARNISPDTFRGFNGRTWASDPKDVSVEFLGFTDKEFQNPVILASFNAG